MKKARENRVNVQIKLIKIQPWEGLINCDARTSPVLSERCERDEKEMGRAQRERMTERGIHFSHTVPALAPMRINGESG